MGHLPSDANRPDPSGQATSELADAVGSSVPSPDPVRQVSDAFAGLPKMGRGATATVRGCARRGRIREADDALRSGETVLHVAVGLSGFAKSDGIVVTDGRVALLRDAGVVWIDRSDIRTATYTRAKLSEGKELLRIVVRERHSYLLKEVEPLGIAQAIARTLSARRQDQGSSTEQGRTGAPAIGGAWGEQRVHFLGGAFVGNLCRASHIPASQLADMERGELRLSDDGSLRLYFASRLRARYELDSPCLSAQAGERLTRSFDAGTLWASAALAATVSPAVGALGLLKSRRSLGRGIVVLGIDDAPDVGMFAIPSGAVSRHVLAQVNAREAAVSSDNPKGNSGRTSPLEQIEKLADLLDKGHITDDEYQEAKRRLLNQL